MRMAMILAAIPLAACGSMAMGGDGGDRATASGSGSSRTFAVADFDRIELKASDDVAVSVGSGFSIRAEGSSEELDLLDIVKDGSTLRVGRVRTNGVHVSRGQGVKIFVTMPRIVGASVAGSGDMRVDRASGDFDGAVAGSGDLSIGTIAANAAKLSIAGSGGISAGGTAQTLDIAIAGSGDVDADGLKATRADVSIAGSGSASAHVSGSANVSIMGSGDVTLAGGAKCTVSRMGSGEAHCG